MYYSVYTFCTLAAHCLHLLGLRSGIETEKGALEAIQSRASQPAKPSTFTRILALNLLRTCIASPFPLQSRRSECTMTSSTGPEMASTSAHAHIAPVPMQNTQQPTAQTSAGLPDPQSSMVGATGSTSPHGAQVEGGDPLSGPSGAAQQMSGVGGEVARKDEGAITPPVPKVSHFLPRRRGLRFVVWPIIRLTEVTQTRKSSLANS